MLKCERRTGDLSDYLKMLGSCLIAISIVVVMASCSLFSPQARLESLISSGKYDEAYSYYRENKSNIDKHDAATAFETALDLMYESYLSGSLDADDIADFVEKLEGLESEPLNAYGANILSKVAEIEASREAYEDAETLFSSGNYPEALEQFRLVVSDDSNYETAQSRITECIETYKTEMMQEAADYIAGSNYEEAIETLNDLTAVIGSDSDVSSALNDYLSQFNDYIFETAQAMADDEEYDEALGYLDDNSEYITDNSHYNTVVADYEEAAAVLLLESNDVAGLVAAGNYDDAFSILNTIGNLYPNSDSYIQQLTSAEDAYTASELAIIQGFIDAGDYESAFGECNTALNRVPGRSELETQRDYCEQRLPVPLSDCFNSMSDDTLYEIGYWEDTDLFGNTYGEDDGYFMCLGTADFYLNGQFDTLSLAVTLPNFGDNPGEDVVNFNVYGDDELIYQQVVTSRTTPDIVTIDVSGVTWLQLEVDGDNFWGSYLFVLYPKLECN